METYKTGSKDNMHDSLSINKSGKKNFAVNKKNQTGNRTKKKEN